MQAECTKNSRRRKPSSALLTVSDPPEPSARRSKSRTTKPIFAPRLDSTFARTFAVTFLGMRSRAHLHEAEAASEFVPASIVEQLNIGAIFGRDAPVEVDLGCGDGTFLVALAAQNPDRNFLGTERLLGRVRSVCRRIARLNLENVRVIRM